jgi:hypothetical protein
MNRPNQDRAQTRFLPLFIPDMISRDGVERRLRADARFVRLCWRIEQQFVRLLPSTWRPAAAAKPAPLAIFQSERLQEVWRARKLKLIRIWDE